MRSVLILVICQFLFVGCVNKPNGKKQKKDSVPTFSTNSAVQNDTARTHAMEGKYNRPFKEIDSLVYILAQNFNFSTVKKLEVICSVSDGELSEYFETISVKIFEEHIKGFTNYFLCYPGSCLKQRLVEGISVNISMYEKSERPVKLKEERKRLIEKATKERMSATQLEFIQYLFKAVDPAIFD